MGAAQHSSSGGGVPCSLPSSLPPCFIEAPAAHRHKLLFFALLNRQTRQSRAELMSLPAAAFDHL